LIAVGGPGAIECEDLLGSENTAHQQEFVDPASEVSVVLVPVPYLSVTEDCRGGFSEGHFEAKRSIQIVAENVALGIVGRSKVNPTALNWETGCVFLVDRLFLKGKTNEPEGAVRGDAPVDLTGVAAVPAVGVEEGLNPASADAIQADPCGQGQLRPFFSSAGVELEMMANVPELEGFGTRPTALNHAVVSRAWWGRLKVQKGDQGGVLAESVEGAGGDGGLTRGEGGL
jgi:hypothetical protein